MGLITNELIKIFKRKTTAFMYLILTVILLVAAAVILFAMDDKGSDKNWKPVLQAENNSLEEQLKTVPGEQNKYFIEKQIAENEYRIEKNIAPEDDYNVFGFMTDMMDMIVFVAIFTITIAAGMIANEFSWGTVKLLLIRPISRVKILLSKYIAVLLFSLSMIAVLLVFSFLIGAIFFGMGDGSPYLAYIEGEIIEKNHILHLVVNYLLTSIGLFMLTTLAFMISAAFRNSSLAIGLSLFLLLMGTTLTNLLSVKFEWPKYILFANTDLIQYFDGVPLIEGMTLSFSITMLAIYFIVFHTIAFLAFVKRDVAA
ncbi:ABC transporter permease [Bacillus sp. M6-12]|uniref:ABC transporter permease n=1 Tax=Bacillus sp. M6-12 TaxID=2054166 RepID=UPI0026ACA794|nr:ABC transporter permease subunit [Bacillus sp. M6-12]